MTDRAKEDDGLPGELPFDRVASSIDPDKEAWKAAGNRFTPEELKRMATSWQSAEIIEESGPEYSVG